MSNVKPIDDPALTRALVEFFSQFDGPGEPAISPHIFSSSRFYSLRKPWHKAANKDDQYSSQD